MDTYKSDNIVLSAKLQSFGEDKSRIIDQNQHLEIQLVTALEKHKICQIEVSQRDQSLIKLQSELNMLSEKYASSLDELKIQQEEIERLNQRIKKQSNDIRELQTANDRLEEKRISTDKSLKQYEYDVETFKQELTKKDRAIENIKAEWTNNIRNHEEEIKGYKQNYQILNEELAHTRSELNEFLNKITNLKQQTNELSTDLDVKNQEREQLNDELSKYEKLAKEQDAKICQYTSEINGLRNSLDSCNSQLHHLNLKLSDMDNKYEHALKHCERLEANLKSANENIIEMKFQVSSQIFIIGRKWVYLNLIVLFRWPKRSKLIRI